MFKHTAPVSSFSVNDIDKAYQFYTGILGLAVVKDKMGILEVQYKEETRIFIYPKKDHTPATFTVLNFEVDNIDTAVDALSALGITCIQYDLPEIKTDAKGVLRGEPNIAWFNDPAGNILSVIAPRPEGS